ESFHFHSIGSSIPILLLREFNYTSSDFLSKPLDFEKEVVYVIFDCEEKN
ncbi:13401_t:CDS:1, partial [Dentiscutata heterogama]